MKLGIYHDLPEGKYNEIPAARNSVLKALATEWPAIVRWRLDHPAEQETKAKIFGRALHCAFNEPLRFYNAYGVLPENAPRRPSKAQRSAKKPSAETLSAIAWWDEFEAENAGKTMISRADIMIIQDMSVSLRKHPESDAFMERDCHYELTAVTEIDGVLCKARADILNEDGWIADLKTIDGISDDNISSAIYQYGYFQQAAFYQDVFAASGLEPEGMVFFVVDKNAPHFTRVIQIDPDDVHLGRLRYRRMLKIYKACTDFDDWPGPPTSIDTLTVPTWARKKLEFEYAD